MMMRKMLSRRRRRIVNEDTTSNLVVRSALGCGCIVVLLTQASGIRYEMHFGDNVDLLIVVMMRELANRYIRRIARGSRVG
jgi:hypothetical protein